VSTAVIASSTPEFVIPNFTVQEIRFFSIFNPTLGKESLKRDKKLFPTAVPTAA
jgi:hypothetical protein